MLICILLLKKLTLAISNSPINPHIAFHRCITTSKMSNEKYQEIIKATITDLVFVARCLRQIPKVKFDKHGFPQDVGDNINIKEKKIN